MSHLLDDAQSPVPSRDTKTLASGGSLLFEGTYVQQVGTIIIDPEPNSITAPWTLTAPDGSERSGAGDTPLPNLIVGNYRLTWGAKQGWTGPNPGLVEKALTNGDTLRFEGTYVQQVGTIEINPEPNSILAPWTLTGPNGFRQTGKGDKSLPNLAVGDYELTWDPQSGWLLPNPSSEQKTLKNGSRIEFAARYGLSGFVYVAPGSLAMGSPPAELGRGPDEVQHSVVLTQGFYMSQFEVTEQWWAEVMGGTTTSSQLPKVGVSWDMAVAFCNKLSERQGLTKAYTIRGSNGDVTWNRSANGYRLPTEAEWEYACRAGTKTAFANGAITYTTCSPVDPKLSAIGWYCGNSGYAPQTIGRKTPNAWQLYDMHGNAWEWVWDGYRSDYQNLPPTDPVHDVGKGSYRVFRGSSWLAPARGCRSAYRDSDYPSFTDSHPGGGFRPVRSAF